MFTRVFQVWMMYHAYRMLQLAEERARNEAHRAAPEEAPTEAPKNEAHRAAPEEAPTEAPKNEAPEEAPTKAPKKKKPLVL